MASVRNEYQKGPALGFHPGHVQRRSSAMKKYVCLQRETAPEKQGAVRIEAVIKEAEKYRPFKARLTIGAPTGNKDTETDTDEDMPDLTDDGVPSRASTLANVVSMDYPMILFDSGTYKHVWGTDMVDAGLIFDTKELPIPEIVNTAAGVVTIKRYGKLRLRGMVFSGVINDMIQISMMSEGLLFVEDKWKITGEGGIKTCEPPAELNVALFRAEMHGHLAFWPQSDIKLAIETIKQENEAGWLAMAGKRAMEYLSLCLFGVSKWPFAVLI